MYHGCHALRRRYALILWALYAFTMTYMIVPVHYVSEIHTILCKMTIPLYMLGHAMKNLDKPLRIYRVNLIGLPKKDPNCG